MRATIDKAGRVVIPAAARARAGLTAGSAVDVRVDDLGPKLGPRGKRLIATPTVPAKERPIVDVAALIEEERSHWP